MISVRISSQDLDRIIVLRLLSLELQITCSYHLIVVVSLYYNPKSEKVGTVWKTQIKKESSDF